MAIVQKTDAEELTPEQKILRSQTWPKCASEDNKRNLFREAELRGVSLLRLTSSFHSNGGWFTIYGVTKDNKEFCAVYRATWGETGKVGPWVVSSVVYRLESLNVEDEVRCITTYHREPEAALMRHKFLWEALNDENN